MTDQTEQRSICRECGRGADAPHRADCESGALRQAFASFDLDRRIAELLLEVSA